MPKLVCCKCKVELRPDKNGVPAIELAEFGPYKIWGSDRWKCPICEYTVLAGFSDESHDHWEEHFDAALNLVRQNENTIEFGIAYTKEEVPYMDKALGLEVESGGANEA
jgi:hypothetical protein